MPLSHNIEAENKMSTLWKQDFFTQLNDLARFRNSSIYDPEKNFGPSTDELEKSAGLTHTAWNIGEYLANWKRCCGTPNS